MLLGNSRARVLLQLINIGEAVRVRVEQRVF